MKYSHLMPIRRCGLYGLRNRMEQLIRVQMEMELLAAVHFD